MQACQTNSSSAAADTLAATTGFLITGTVAVTEGADSLASFARLLSAATAIVIEGPDQLASDVALFIVADALLIDSDTLRSTLSTAPTAQPGFFEISMPARNPSVS